MPEAPHLALIGLPGAGKSTVGRLVAQRTSRPFVDLDVEIERREGRTIPEIFADDGEDYFRVLERAITESLVPAPSSILAPGGGWVTQEATVALLRPRTRLVWLRVTAPVALRRIGGNRSDRPLLMKGDPLAELTRLEREREGLYRLADATVDTESIGLQEVALQVVQLASFWGIPVG